MNPVRKQAQTIDVVVRLVSISPHSLSRHEDLWGWTPCWDGNQLSAGSISRLGGLLGLKEVDMFRRR